MKPGDLVRVQRDMAFAPEMRDRTFVFIRELPPTEYIILDRLKSAPAGEFLNHDGRLFEANMELFEVVQTTEPVG